MQHNTQVPVGKHNNRQHASPHHEVATDVKQMPIRPIIIIINNDFGDDEDEHDVIAMSDNGGNILYKNGDNRSNQ